MRFSGAELALKKGALAGGGKRQEGVGKILDF